MTRENTKVDHAELGVEDLINNNGLLILHKILLEGASKTRDEHGVVEWITELASIISHSEYNITGSKKAFQNYMLKIAGTALAAYQWADRFNKKNRNGAVEIPLTRHAHPSLDDVVQKESNAEHSGSFGINTMRRLFARKRKTG